MKTSIIVCAIAAVLTGCATPAPAPVERPAQISDDLVGQKPSEAEVQTFISNMMKDPESAKFRMGLTHKCYMRGAPVSGAKIVAYGWCTRLSVSGKNSYGGYVGYHEVRVFTSNLGEMRRYTGNMWFTEDWLKE